jgi:hypothetical protein
MSNHMQYAPGPARGAHAEKDGEKWTLVLVRELRHSPENVWQALTDPEQLREWAPFEVDQSLGVAGSMVKLKWASTMQITETKVTRAEASRLLEYNDMRWQLEPMPSGTRLTLWHSIDRRFIAWGAAGWHICLDVMDRFIAGDPLGRIVGGDAMKFEWQRLNVEYAEQFGMETPSWRPPSAKS